ERDAGVFRSFRQFVEQGDRFVEPIPVTRRSRRVLERTIAGLELARLLMLHEPNSGTALTTVRALKAYVASGQLDFDEELRALIDTLALNSDLDEPLKRDLIDWFEKLAGNVDSPPS